MDDVCLSYDLLKTIVWSTYDGSMTGLCCVYDKIMINHFWMVIGKSNDYHITLTWLCFIKQSWGTYCNVTASVKHCMTVGGVFYISRTATLWQNHMISTFLWRMWKWLQACFTMWNEPRLDHGQFITSIEKWLLIHTFSSSVFLLNQVEFTGMNGQYYHLNADLINLYLYKRPLNLYGSIQYQQLGAIRAVQGECETVYWVHQQLVNFRTGIPSNLLWWQIGVMTPELSQLWVEIQLFRKVDINSLTLELSNGWISYRLCWFITLP